MSEGEEIVARARSLFDVAGVATDPATGDTILILGLVTTPERDLDVFASDGDRTIIMPGFAEYAKPGQDTLLDFIRERGYNAGLVGVYGYPHEGLNLKHLAVAAGLGRQGKNTVIISPDFGPWLRFMSVRTNAPLATTGPGVYTREESPYCGDCEACIKACPVGILEPYRLTDTDTCLAAISHDRPGGVAICEECVVVCPVGERKLP